MEHIVAAYVRTSIEKDDAFSLDSQLEAVRRFAIAHSLRLPAEYEFREECTGTLLERPKLTILRELIKAGKVTAVIVHATDRLARKVGLADMLLHEFFAHNVKLYIVQWGSEVKNTPEDKVRFNFEATFSDLERRKIAERTTRGKKDKVRQGLYLGTGKPPFGYRAVGRKREIRLEIIEEQAAIIRQIFDWYVIERIGVQDIIRRLHGIPTPSEALGVRNFPHKRRGKGEWSDGTIYWILRNATYSGTLTMFGSIVHVPAIVDADLFALAQERMELGRQQAFRAEKYEYLVGRRLTCAFCGYAMEVCPHRKDGVLVRYYYRCPSWRLHRAKHKCALPGFRADQVDGAVWEWVRDLLREPATLRQVLNESQRDLREQHRDLGNRLARLETRLDEEGKRLAVLLREFADIEARGDTSPAAATVRDIYRQAKDQAQFLFTELAEERDKLKAELSGVSIDDSLIDELTLLAETGQAEIDSLPFQGKRALIEKLGISGELAVEDNQRVVYIICYTHRFRRVLQ